MIVPREQGTGNRNGGCRTSKSLPLWGRWRAAPDEVPSRCASRLCSNKRRTSDKDLIRLSAKTQAFSPKSTFPRKAEILRGFPVSPLAKLILTNQRFGKITGEGFWLGYCVSPRQIRIYLQLPYSLPRHPSRRGRGGGHDGIQGFGGHGGGHGVGQGFGGHGRGGRRPSQAGRQSRFTHTTRFPHSSTPSSTSAHSPGRQGFSIVTRRHAHSSGSRPAPQRAPPNTGTRTQASRSQSYPIRG